MNRNLFLFFNKSQQEYDLPLFNLYNPSHNFYERYILNIMMII